MYKPILRKEAPKYNPKKDYCTKSPDQLLNCNFNKACYWHDRQYRNQLINRKSRLMSDLYLWIDIVIECWKVRKSSIFWSWRIGMIYFLVVRVSGVKYYR